jgi:hypothetical protein
MSSGAPPLAKTTHHPERLADRVAMAMRTMIGRQPPGDLGPAGRTAFDELMTRAPSAEGVTNESTVVGGVAGWWCRPANAVATGAILYLHGGAYVVGSEQACRHFAGQIASRMSSPPTSPFCTPLARRWMSLERFSGAISPTATFRTLSDHPTRMEKPHDPHFIRRPEA